MKKYLIALAAALVMGVAVSYAQSYSRNGKEFSSVAKTRTAEPARKTGYTWKDSKGKSYDIYMSSKGSCYIIRTSAKTGKEYRSYLPKEVSREIAKELGK